MRIPLTIAVIVLVAASVTGVAGEEPSVAQRLQRLIDDHESEMMTYLRSLPRGLTKEESKAVKVPSPDFSACVRRIMELAAREPKSPATRDAMVWIIRQTLGHGDEGPYGGEFAMAGERLVRGFGDDPDAIRVGLDLSAAPSARKDYLVHGFMASAKGRESKGLARLALARYLDRKSEFARFARTQKGRMKIRFSMGNGLKDETEDESDARYAYRMQLAQCDPDYLRSEADRLFEEVIKDYGDVPYATVQQMRLENLLKQPDAKFNGEPLTAENRRRIEQALAQRKTLGEVAEAAIDDRSNLAVGKPAPEIEGVDLDGKPLKLSDFRGKVVALVFWGTWCGPCMAAIPREKALVERMKGRPFVMLGVNTDSDPAKARKLAAEKGADWRSWRDGEPDQGPITKRYRIQGFPTVYVIDADGKIQSKKALGDSLDELAEKLVKARESAVAKP